MAESEAEIIQGIFDTLDDEYTTWNEKLTGRSSKVEELIWEFLNEAFQNGNAYIDATTRTVKVDYEAFVKWINKKTDNLANKKVPGLAGNGVQVAGAVQPGVVSPVGKDIKDTGSVLKSGAANKVFDEIASGELEVKSNIVSVSDSAASSLYIDDAPSDNAFGNALTMVDSSVYDSTDKALNKAEAAPVNTNTITPQDINAIGASIVSAIIQQKNQGVDISITLDNPALLQAVVNEDKNYKRNHGRSAFA